MMKVCEATFSCFANDHHKIAGVHHIKLMFLKGGHSLVAG
ncbi:hypothetical protein C900_03412 [Fulvivirga imtechensis AK7]|uniref:Uncharacterized protein n=1 Tax=Fulvivirga imtechensis AK7 TaxID=1237149 RepID=L8JTH7_9BACT|nr:hypothetical protein C900_03412 [Fulvivirga imtechensis AK7]